MNKVPSKPKNLAKAALQLKIFHQKSHGKSKKEYDRNKEKSTFRQKVFDRVNESEQELLK